MKRTLSLVLVIIMAMSLFVGCAPKESNVKAFPYEKTVEIIAPANPGGGWDSTARALQKVITENKLAGDVNVVVSNLPGGNGSVAWNGLINEKNPHKIAMDSSYIYLNRMLGMEDSPTINDVTPIATLTNEWIGVFVSIDSPYNSITELFDAVKADIESVQFAVAPGKGNDDHLATLTSAKAYGIDVAEFDKNIVATDTSELLTGIMGGFYDVCFTGALEGLEFVEAGNLKCLGITANERYTGKYDFIPTLQEQGLDVIFPHWRGLLAAPGMSEEEIKWWNDVIEAAIATDDWKEILENNEWVSYYRNSADTKAMWEEEIVLYESLVKASGLMAE
ncbi:MAG: tripartite tricarboxylate transporter substrate binding protein [Tissierellales bacterium]|nr:tripartite tricarboxylate transporter substrate binding protein [Tissierellales bacterium]MBN2826432.1 tripartite tricarboxylate transporter substrate binding protein [Tissierellales bacterium]